MTTSTRLTSKPTSLTDEPRVRHRWALAGPRRDLEFTDEPLTEQHHAKDCDINSILAKFRATGLMPGSRDPTQAFDGDFSDVPGLAEAFAVVQEAQESFDSLPAEVRGRYASPVAFAEALADPANADFFTKHGLLQLQQSSSQAPGEPAPQGKGGQGQPSAESPKAAP